MLKMIPTPKQAEQNEGKTAELPCRICTHCDEWQRYVDAFCDTFYSVYEIKPEQGEGGVELFCDSDLKQGEYQIEAENMIRIKAADSEGVLYALASLLQLIQVENGHIIVAQTKIFDYPEKDYRALMVDLGRFWHPFDKLLKLVDICFFYKIKYLNLHFIDVKLYTLPSKKFPKLPTPNKHYSFEQIEYLRKYASDRGVIIVPEYECPGHAIQFNRAYPEIFSDSLAEGYNGSFYTEVGGKITHEDIVCACSEKSREATRELLREICEMFPESPYINIGGDEAQIDVWNHCSECSKYMKEHGIADAKELYGEYVGRVCKYILSLGKTPMVWEGFPKQGNHWVPKETIVIAWESHYQMPYELLEDGFRVVNSSWQPLYIVQHYRERWDPRDILKWNVYNWQHWWNQSEAFLNPIHVAPTENVIGSMMCAWDMTYDQEINFIIENLAAMSERVWNVKRIKSDEQYFDSHLHVSRIASWLVQDK